MTNQVSVFVGGVQKSGTRSVSQYFRQHPEMTIHDKKEGHFFDRPENFINDIPITSKLNEYHNNFKFNSNNNVMCDITPDYVFRRAAVRRIYNYNPKAIWIILLRNPIERAFSAWNMEVSRKTENLSFEKALLSELNGNPKERTHDRFQYIDRSRYYSQLLNLWKYFPRTQCRIYSAESVWNHPKTFFKEMFEFINVSINIEDQYKQVHKGIYKSEMPVSARNLLNTLLYFELTELPNILSWVTNPWKIK